MESELSSILTIFIEFLDFLIFYLITHIADDVIIFLF